MRAGSLVHQALPMVQDAAQGLSGGRRRVAGGLGCLERCRWHRKPLRGSQVVAGALRVVLDAWSAADHDRSSGGPSLRA